MLLNVTLIITVTNSDKNSVIVAPGSQLLKEIEKTFQLNVYSFAMCFKKADFKE